MITDDRWSDRNTVSPEDYTEKSVQKVWWECDAPPHHQWYASIRSVVARGHGCSVCEGKQVYPGVNDFASQSPRAHNWVDEEDPSTVYYRSRKKYKMQCDKGHPPFSASLSNVHVGKWCPYCSGRVPIPGETDIFSVHPELERHWDIDNTIDPKTVKASSNMKVKWVCDKGHKWSTEPYNVTNGSWCPYCSGRRTDHTNSLATTNPNLVSQWHPTKNHPVTPEDITPGSEFRAWWQCPENPDHQWQTYVYNRRNTGCPRCALTKTTSKPQTELESFISQLTPDYTTNDRTVLGPKYQEVDIYIPDCRLALEFNGTYNHSSARYSAPRKEARKTQAAIDNGIRLVHVWEHQWNDPVKQNIIKRHITGLLGKDASPRVYARSTQFTGISFREAASFLNTYHIQGQASGSYYYGLKHHEHGLVAVAVFTYHKSTDTLVLDRYATSVRVPGGHSKIISNIPPYRKLVTFADLQYSYGDLYENTGWEVDAHIPPDYSYLYRGKVYHKFNFRKKRFASDPNLKFFPEMTESQLAEVNNVFKVWDCGKIRYVKYNHIQEDI